MLDTVIQQHQKKVPIICIAGLNIAITGAEFLWNLGRDYLVNAISNVDIAFDATEYALALQKENPDIFWEKCCYVAAARILYSKLLAFDGFVLHASTVVLDGKAYLFSANSETGKSTHTALWCEHFGNSRAYILNDDKPILRKVNGKYMAFGAPWCGNSNLGVNNCAPIQGIAFLEQAKSDWIQPIQPMDSLPRLLHQTEQTMLPKGLTKFLSIMEDFIINVPMYRMGCTISKNAVVMASSIMSQEAGEVKCKHTA